ncbi:MAG: rRNA pseudouridine synthase [Proteobacteria bacterium]|nr:rRNA pseudouridine synthase [Pseudomonadota bacterium]
MKIRLQKIIADAGIASRREAERLIQEGRVTVNGKVITELGFKADPIEDYIKVDGKLIKRVEKIVYLLFNKPKEVMCTTNDPEGRETIFDIVKKGVKERVWPVGRLDYHSEGLILLTNDGELTMRLTHPKYKVEKVYEVKVKDFPTEDKLNKLRNGVYLEDGKTLPCEIEFIKKTKENSWYKVVLREGKKQQIRRMFMKIAHPVMKLKRIAIGPLKLGKLPIGSYRYLTEKEIAELKKSVGL